MVPPVYDYAAVTLRRGPGVVKKRVDVLPAGEKANYRRISVGFLIATISMVSCLVVLPAVGAGSVTRNPGSFSSAASQDSSTHSTSTSSSPTFGQGTATLSGIGASSMPISTEIGTPAVVPSSNGTIYAVSALVAAGAAASTLYPSAQYSGGACGWDGLDDTVYECVTMYYNIKSDTANYFADDAQVSDEAVNGDPHDAVLTKTSLTTGGVGTPCNSGSELDGGQTWNINSPSSGTTYYETPSWAGNYYRLSSSAGECSECSRYALLHLPRQSLLA